MLVKYLSRRKNLVFNKKGKKKSKKLRGKTLRGKLSKRYATIRNRSAARINRVALYVTRATPATAHEVIHSSSRQHGEQNRQNEGERERLAALGSTHVCDKGQCIRI